MINFIPDRLVNRRNSMRSHTRGGFTLIELLAAITILTICLSGLLLSYANMLFISDLARDMTLANTAARSIIEDIKRVDFDQIPALNGSTSTINGFANNDAIMRTEVFNTAYNGLLRVRVVAFFRSRGRLIGEDTDLDGAMDIGEDANNNNRLDSPVEIVTLIAR